MSGICGTWEGSATGCLQKEERNDPSRPPFISPVAFQQHVIWDLVSTEWIKLYYTAALKEN